MNAKTQISTFIFLERLWLAGAAIGMFFVIYFLINKDNDSALFFFGFFILSSVIYLMRKRQRKKHEAYLKWVEEQKQAGRTTVHPKSSGS